MQALVTVDVTEAEVERCDFSDFNATEVLVQLPSSSLVHCVQVEDVDEYEVEGAEGRLGNGLWQALACPWDNTHWDGRQRRLVLGACDAVKVRLSSQTAPAGKWPARVSVTGLPLHTPPPFEAAFPLLNLKHVLQTALLDIDEGEGGPAATLRRALRHCTALCGQALLHGRRNVQALELWALCAADTAADPAAPAVEDRRLLLTVALLSAHLLKTSNPEQAQSSLPHLSAAVAHYRELRAAVAEYDPCPLFAAHAPAAVPRVAGPPPTHWGDWGTSLPILQPDLLAMLLYCATAPVCAPVEALREAAVRTLQLVLDTLGCGVGWQFADVLQAALQGLAPPTGLAEAAPAPDLQADFERLVETLYDLIPRIHPAALRLALQFVIVPIVEGNTASSLLPTAFRFLLPLLNRCHGPVSANVVVRLVGLAAAPRTPLQQAAKRLLNAILLHFPQCLTAASLRSFVDWSVTVLTDDPMHGPPTPTYAPAPSAADFLRPVGTLLAQCQQLAQRVQPSPAVACFSALQLTVLQVVAALARQVHRRSEYVLPPAPAPPTAPDSAIRWCSCCQANPSDAAATLALLEPRCDVSCGCQDAAEALAWAVPADPVDCLDIPTLPSPPPPAPLLELSAALAKALPTLLTVLRGALDGQDARLAAVAHAVWPATEAVAALCQAHHPALFRVADVLRPILAQALELCLHSCPSEAHQQTMKLLLRHATPAPDLAPLAGAYLAALCQWLPNTLHDTTFGLARVLLGVVGPLASPAALLALLDALSDPATPRNAASNRLFTALVTVTVSHPPYLEALLEPCLFRAAPAAQPAGSASEPLPGSRPPEPEPRPRPFWSPAAPSGEAAPSVPTGIFVERLCFARRCVVHFARRLKRDDGDAPPLPDLRSPAFTPREPPADAVDFSFTLGPSAAGPLPPLTDDPADRSSAVAVLDRLAAPLAAACAALFACPMARGRAAAGVIANAVAPLLARRPPFADALAEAVERGVDASLRYGDGPLALSVAALAHRMAQPLAEGGLEAEGAAVLRRLWPAVCRLLHGTVLVTVHRAALFCLVSWAQRLGTASGPREEAMVVPALLGLLAEGSPWQWQLAGVAAWGAYVGLLPPGGDANAAGGTPASEPGPGGPKECTDKEAAEQVWAAVLRLAGEGDAAVAALAAEVAGAARRLRPRCPRARGPAAEAGAGAGPLPPLRGEPPGPATQLPAVFPALLRRLVYLPDRLAADWEEYGDQEKAEAFPALPSSPAYGSPCRRVSSGGSDSELPRSPSHSHIAPAANLVTRVRSSPTSPKAKARTRPLRSPPSSPPRSADPIPIHPGETAAAPGSGPMPSLMPLFRGLSDSPPDPSSPTGPMLTVDVSSTASTAAVSDAPTFPGGPRSAVVHRNATSPRIRRTPSSTFENATPASPPIIVEPPPPSESPAEGPPLTPAPIRMLSAPAATDDLPLPPSPVTWASGMAAPAQPAPGARGRGTLSPPANPLKPAPHVFTGSLQRIGSPIVRVKGELQFASLLPLSSKDGGPDMDGGGSANEIQLSLPARATHPPPDVKPLALPARPASDSPPGRTRGGGGFLAVAQPPAGGHALTPRPAFDDDPGPCTVDRYTSLDEGYGEDGRKAGSPSRAGGSPVFRKAPSWGHGDDLLDLDDTVEYDAENISPERLALGRNSPSARGSPGPEKTKHSPRAAGSPTQPISEDAGAGL